MFKRKAPIVIGLGLVFAAAAAIALLRPEPRDADLVTPAAAWTRAHYQRLGHTLGPDSLESAILARTDTEGFVRVVARAPGVEQTHHLRLTCDGDWRVAGDLNEDFGRYLVESKTAESLPARLSAACSKRQINPAGVRVQSTSYTVSWIDRPIGSLETLFLDGTQPCRFLETFVYRNGAWAPDGEGQFFFSPGMPPPRKK